MSAFDEALVARTIAAWERQRLDLYDLKVTVDGPGTPAVVDVAEQLRRMIAEAVPDPVPVLIPHRNRAQRRAYAARQRRRA